MNPLRRLETHTKNKLRNQRRIIYACKYCFTWHEGPGKPGACRQCKTTQEFHRFDSRIEAVHAAELILRRKLGHLRDLTFHPRFVARVMAQGGKDSTISWTPDGSYIDKRGQRIVYDVKPKNAPLDPVHKLKERIFRDILNATVIIVRK